MKKSHTVVADCVCCALAAALAITFFAVGFTLAGFPFLAAAGYFAWMAGK